MEPPVFSESTPKPRSEEAAIKDRVYRAVSNQIREILVETPLTRINREIGMRITEAVIEVLFTTAIKEGYLRFPGGFGSFRIARLKRMTMPKVLPNNAGTVKMSPNRMKLRYEAGVTVREALGMPPQTTYVRQFDRKSALSEKTQEILNAAEETLAPSV